MDGGLSSRVEVSSILIGGATGSDAMVADEFPSLVDRVRFLAGPLGSSPLRNVGALPPLVLEQAPPCGSVGEDLVKEGRPATAD